MFRTMNEATAAWKADRAMLAAKGISFAYGAEPKAYASEGALANFNMALDALPTLTTDPNSAVPWALTNLIDPTVFRVVFTPDEAASIYGEVRKGTWLDATTMFPVIEHTGEVSSYGDFNTNAQSRANTNWPQRQSYLFQTNIEYGERELELAGLARINWASELQQSAAGRLNKYQNITYFFGVANLQTYGAVNDPNLTASLTPAPKSYGGTAWISGGTIKATANEILLDIESMFIQLVAQAGGNITKKDELILVMSPTISVALTATNTFNVNVEDLLNKNFPRLRVETAVELGAQSASQPYGIAGGNLVQMIAPKVQNQDTMFVAFNEKLRAHRIVSYESSWRQKYTSGTWGAVIRGAFAISSMLGV